MPGSRNDALNYEQNEAAVPLTTRTILCVGSYHKALYRNDR